MVRGPAQARRPHTTPRACSVQAAVPASNPTSPPKQNRNCVSARAQHQAGWPVCSQSQGTRYQALACCNKIKGGWWWCSWWQLQRVGGKTVAASGSAPLASSARAPARAQAAPRHRRAQRALPPATAAHSRCHRHGAARRAHGPRRQQQRRARCALGRPGRTAEAVVDPVPPAPKAPAQAPPPPAAAAAAAAASSPPTCLPGGQCRGWGRASSRSRSATQARAGPRRSGTRRTPRVLSPPATVRCQGLVRQHITPYPLGHFVSFEFVFLHVDFMLPPFICLNENPSPSGPLSSPSR